MADMPMSRSGKWTPFIFFLVLVIGMLFGYFIASRSSSRTIFNIVQDRNDPLREIINLIDDQYVDSVNTDSLYADAVSGILKHLDPHTIYIPASELAQVNEDLEGSFKGIGVEFLKLRDTVLISAVLSDGPSAKAGLMPGDRIIKVDENIVSGVSITNDALIKKLRGQENSIVTLSIMRPMQATLLEVPVKRGIIPLYSIDAAYMLDAVSGYVKINRFSATTYDEFRNALKVLKAKGMQQIILDLRQNPGGYLDDAIAIADEFLNEGKLVVYTQGRKSKKEDYKADRPGTMEDSRVVVIIDEGSASASEILAGALQDWDRGVIIGRQSFGKGLVQEQFQLSDGSALRLTVARYYTPSGRSIQRSYALGKDVYEADYYKRYADTSVAPDTLSLQDTIPYYTQVLHRRLTGSGGIIPDIFLPQIKWYQSAALAHLMGTDVMSTFISEYYSGHVAELKKYPDFVAYDKGFVISNETMNDLKSAFILENAAYTKEVWNDAATVSHLESLIKAQLAKMLFNAESYYRVLNETDQAVARALEVINGTQYATILSAKK